MLFQVVGENRADSRVTQRLVQQSLRVVQFSRNPIAVSVYFEDQRLSLIEGKEDSDFLSSRIDQFANLVLSQALKRRQFVHFRHY